MSWNYSDLSHTAKTHGGPEKYIQLIKSYTTQETNKKWLKGTIPTLLILAPLAIKGAITIHREMFPKIKHFFNYSEISKEEAKEAEDILSESFQEND